MGRDKNVVPTQRLVMEMPVTLRKRLDQMRDETKVASVSEVVRRALAIYERLLLEARTGGVPMIRRKDGVERELVIIP